jgi:hypothetical protein
MKIKEDITLSLPLRREQRLRMFQNEELRRIFRPRRWGK